MEEKKKNLRKDGNDSAHSNAYILAQQERNAGDRMVDVDENFIDRLIKRLKQNKPENTYINGFYGVGIGMKKSEVLEFSNNIINDNVLPGLAMTGNSSVTGGEKNLFVENGIDNTPNIALFDNSYLNLSETKIQKGDATNIYLSNSCLILEKCRIEKYSNRSIIAEKGSVLKINGETIQGNGAEGTIPKK
jgi:hypothetical protein